MRADVQELLDEAAAAQLHKHVELWGHTTGVYTKWMQDRQQLTDLISRLANKVTELSEGDSQ